jgi:hypothetical protein
MGKRRPKFKRYSRKRELRLIRIIFTKGSRIARNTPRKPVSANIPPDLLWGATDCDTCGEQNLYYRRWDAQFCPACNVWKEKKCSDPECWFCPGRSDVPFSDDEQEQWKRGELVAHEHEEPDSAQTRRRVNRLNRLKTKKSKKLRVYEKRGLKFRDPRWYQKYYSKHLKDEVQENEDA